MFIGYNTNGFAHHALEDAISILAELGYGGIGLTLDHATLYPGQSGLAAKVERTRALLEANRLTCVVETGARFLLDPRRKHQPTLLSDAPAERRRRFDFLRDCVHIARDLGAGEVSFWSGSPPDDTPAEVLRPRLVEQCRTLAEDASIAGVRLAFEPEPGMWIDTMACAGELLSAVDHPAFGLTLDVGHLQCLGELPISKYLIDYRDRLWNVHIEDMKTGIHDHAMFGEGDIDFADVFEGLNAAQYRGGLYVELSRHSHDAVETARRAIDFLRGFMAGVPTTLTS